MFAADFRVDVDNSFISLNPQEIHRIFLVARLHPSTLVNEVARYMTWLERAFLNRALIVAEEQLGEQIIKQLMEYINKKPFTMTELPRVAGQFLAVAQAVSREYERLVVVLAEAYAHQMLKDVNFIRTLARDAVGPKRWKTLSLMVKKLSQEITEEAFISQLKAKIRPLQRQMLGALATFDDALLGLVTSARLPDFLEGRLPALR